jgi:c-di-GMP-related signal transduction protein
VEAYESRYNELGLILSLVELLEEDIDNEEIVERVAKILKVNKSRVKRAIKSALRIATKMTSTGSKDSQKT